MSKFSDHVKDFQMVYGFAVIIFGLGAMSTQVMTVSAHAEDMQKQDAANTQILKILHDENNRLRSEIELVDVNSKINRLLHKNALSEAERGELRYLEKRQDKLLDAIHDS